MLQRMRSHLDNNRGQSPFNLFALWSLAQSSFGLAGQVECSVPEVTFVFPRSVRQFYQNFKNESLFWKIEEI